MSKFAFTRRQFNLMLVASAVAFQAEGGAQEPALPDINAWLPSPMPAEQVQKVAEAVKGLRKTQEKLRAYPLPEGSEPAFTFQPKPLRETKR
ncbi:MAG: hypothetical protein C4335_04830 [Armatimonadota bacterium]